MLTSALFSRVTFIKDPLFLEITVIRLQTNLRELMAGYLPTLNNTVELK